VTCPKIEIEFLNRIQRDEEAAAAAIIKEYGS
jgi:hypothetical protein